METGFQIGRKRTFNIQSTCLRNTVEDSNPTMWLKPVQLRSTRDDPKRIKLLVGHKIVAFDVVKIDRIGDPGVLIQLSRVCPQVLKINDPVEIGLKVSHIDRVKANKSCEEAPIGLSQLVTHEIALCR